jgi:hypothetical protein
MDPTIMPSPEVLVAANWSTCAPATTPQAAGPRGLATGGNHPPQTVTAKD